MCLNIRPRLKIDDVVDEVAVDRLWKRRLGSHVGNRVLLEWAGLCCFPADFVAGGDGDAKVVRSKHSDSTLFRG